MDAAIIPYNARVLVSDARKALLLRNIGTAFSPSFEVEKVIEAPYNAPTHEKGTDRPGRTAMGVHRSGMGEADFHEQEEERFSSLVAERLGAICDQNEIDKLFVVAPPKALAELRKAMPEALRSRVVAEYSKDLVNLPVPEIEKHFSS